MGFRNQHFHPPIPDPPVRYEFTKLSRQYICRHAAHMRICEVHITRRMEKGKCNSTRER